MKTFGLARIGRDVEPRFLPNGKQVINLALAFNYFIKGEKHTQWIDASLWEPREALVPYLQKGGQVSVVVDDVHIETYEGKNGTGSKLVGRVSSIELAGSPQQDAPKAAPAPRPAAQRPAPARESFEMDSDVPF